MKLVEIRRQLQREGAPVVLSTANVILELRKRFDTHDDNSTHAAWVRGYGTSIAFSVLVWAQRPDLYLAKAFFKQAYWNELHVMNDWASCFDSSERTFTRAYMASVERPAFWNLADQVAGMIQERWAKFNLGEGERPTFLYSGEFSDKVVCSPNDYYAETKRRRASTYRLRVTRP